MKTKFLFLLSAFTLSALLFFGCAGTPAPVGQVGVQAGPGGTNLVGQLVWSPMTNLDLTVGGAFDPVTGQWGGNLLITFKEVPDEATRLQLFKVRAVHVANAEGVAFLVPSRSRNLNDPELQDLLARAAGSPGGYTLQRIR